MNFWSRNLFDLDPGILVHATMAKVLVPQLSYYKCGLLMRGRCAWALNFGPVTLWDITLTLGFLCILLFPRYWHHCGQILCGLPMGIDVHGYRILLLLLWLDLALGMLMHTALSKVSNYVLMDPLVAGPSLTWSVYSFWPLVNFQIVATGHHIKVAY